ncbi:hypothetical protein NQ314_013706 [Rhamnusium bicolor]|uniref:WKF domain-containing protein n=1 Tax=Rhamnusium bicolor TaxID=1586634 RepID=A0AAV8X657_9CUCU|nr:hypothetical protein NQ314_013706 [Rhamnusium bicolor]
MGFKDLSKPKKTKKHKKLIAFDEEIITKDNAIKHLSEEVQSVDRYKSKREISTKCEEIMSSEKSEIKLETCEKVNIENNANETSSKNKIKKRKKVSQPNELIKANGNCDEEKDSFTEIKIKKRKKSKSSDDLKLKEDLEENGQVDVQKSEKKNSESIRAQKRKKHAKLLEEKRLKAVVATQQNVLNYLSKWKHSRDEWKFEKLKQIWLQQNLFDCSKIPNEFWETAVDYFSGSKGFIRNCVLRDALKIIENENESSQEDNADENYLLILKRARDIVQTLQD